MKDYLNILMGTHGSFVDEKRSIAESIADLGPEMNMSWNESEGMFTTQDIEVEDGFIRFCVSPVEENDGYVKHADIFLEKTEDCIHYEYNDFLSARGNYYNVVFLLSALAAEAENLYNTQILWH